MAKIKLSELKDALEMLRDDDMNFFSRRTGEIIYIPADYMREKADEEKLEEIDENDEDYVRLPTRYDINEYDIMQDFIYSLPDNTMSAKLARAIQGRGAFRRFRDVLNDYDETERWYAYRDASLEKIGREWAEANEVEIDENIPSVMHILEGEEEGEEVHGILIVIDMQNDFIDGSLGTKEAVQIVPSVIAKIKSYPKENVYATRDTHPRDYLDTQEGKYLPVKHCIQGTKGWQIQKDIAALIEKAHIYDKPAFGSVKLAEDMQILAEKEDIEIELVGLCTDICVVSNALMLKAYMPEVKISVDPACCAGVTPEKHRAALETMKSCQIQGID